MALVHQRLGHYFVANDVKDGNKKRAILLSSCGVNTYAVIRNLLAPDLPSTKSFDQIVEAASKHFNLKPLSIVQHTSDSIFMLERRESQWQNL